MTYAEKNLRAQRLAVGTDIVEISRIRRMMQDHAQFATTVFTRREIVYCQRKRHQYQHFAARFAAKESVMKAVGRGWLQGLQWTDIEVENLPGGQPAIKAHGTLRTAMRQCGIASFAVSLSHCRQYALATVVGVQDARRR